MGRHRSTTEQEHTIVTVKVFGGLRESLGASSLDITLPPRATIRSLLAVMEADRPELVGKLKSGISDGYLNVLVNGRNIRFLDDLDTQLHQGDSVALLPPVGGG